MQFDYTTPRTLSANLTMQYSLTNSLSAQAAYVMTDGSSLQINSGLNNVTQILPQGASTTDAVPFPDFGHGTSYAIPQGRSIYNGLQAKLEQQFAHNLTYLVAYTYSKTLSDAGDLLNGGSQTNGYACTLSTGLGPSFDWALANFDIRNVFHASGSYLLPIGKDQKYMHDAGKLANAVFGGWSANWIYTLQGGQPISFAAQQVPLQVRIAMTSRFRDKTKSWAYTSARQQDPKESRTGLEIQPHLPSLASWLFDPRRMQSFRILVPSRVAYRVPVRVL